MIYEKTIGNFRFVAQTTFYMYVNDNPIAIMTTSSAKEFNRQKKMAKDGKIKARYPKTIKNQIK